MAKRKTRVYLGRFDNAQEGRLAAERVLGTLVMPLGLEGSQSYEMESTDPAIGDEALGAGDLSFLERDWPEERLYIVMPHTDFQPNPDGDDHEAVIAFNVR